MTKRNLIAAALLFAVALTCAGLMRTSPSSAQTGRKVKRAAEPRARRNVEKFAPTPVRAVELALVEPVEGAPGLSVFNFKNVSRKPVALFFYAKTPDHYRSVVRMKIRSPPARPTRASWTRRIAMTTT